MPVRRPDEQDAPDRANIRKGYLPNTITLGIHLQNLYQQPANPGIRYGSMGRTNLWLTCQFERLLPRDLRNLFRLSTKASTTVTRWLQ